MATSKTKKISLIDQMDIRKSKSAKVYDNGGGIAPGKMDDSDEGTNPNDDKNKDPFKDPMNYTKAAQGLLSMASNRTQAKQQPGGPPVQQNSAIASDAAAGMSAGSSFGPYGMAIGAAVGTVAGIGQDTVNAKNYQNQVKGYKDSTLDAANRDSVYNSKAGYNQYEWGGEVKKNWRLSENNSNNYNYPASQGSEGGGAGSGYKKGGGIHIKPENKGKFNATKAATGKTTEELTHSSNPVTKKRAVFAQNASHWKHADGGETLAKVNDTGKAMTSKAPSLMHWMSPSWMPAHMAEGGPMYWLQNAMQNNKPASYTDSFKTVKPNTAEGGVSRSEKGGAAMFEEGGQISEKSPITAPRRTPNETGGYVNNLPHEGDVYFKEGGPMSKEYGIVPGNGHPRADDKTLMADNGGFVVPNDKLQKGKSLLAMAGKNPNTKLSMNKGGDAAIKISSKELYMNPQVKEEVKEKTGMDDEDFERELSPNSKYNKHMADGGPMKPSSTSMRENIDEHQRKTYPGGGNMGYRKGGGIMEMMSQDTMDPQAAGTYSDYKDPNSFNAEDTQSGPLATQTTQPDNSFTPKSKYRPGMNVLDPNSNFKNKNPYIKDPAAAKMAKGVMESSAESTESTPNAESQTDQYDDYSNANKGLMAVGEGLNLASTIWNMSQQYKQGPKPVDYATTPYERNFEAERGAMNRDIDRSTATAQYNARNVNQTAATNVGLAANEASQRMHVSEIIGDKQEAEKVRVDQEKRTLQRSNIDRASQWASREAEGARQFTAQKGQAISENISQAYGIGSNYVNTKLGIGGIKSAETANTINSMALSDYQSSDPARQKRAQDYFNKKGIDIKSYLNILSQNVGKDKNVQNSGG
jgi:hypothetical protein